MGGLAASQMAATAPRWAAAAHPAAGREHAAPAGVDQLHLDLQLPVHHSTGITHAGMCSQPMYTLTVADTGSGPAPVQRSVPGCCSSVITMEYTIVRDSTIRFDASLFAWLASGRRAAGAQPTLSRDTQLFRSSRRRLALCNSTCSSTAQPARARELSAGHAPSGLSTKCRRWREQEKSSAASRGGDSLMSSAANTSRTVGEPLMRTYTGRRRCWCY